MSYNWEQHYRNISQKAKIRNRTKAFAAPQVQFGTIMGMYSIAELKDLIANKDAVVKSINDTFTAWSPTYPGDFSTWQTAWSAVQANYAKARAEADSAILAAKLNPLPDTMISADGTYKDILHSLNPSWELKTIAPGSLDDLSAQLTAMGAPAADGSSFPQPKAGSDIDLATYNKTNDAIKTGKAVAKAAGGAVSDLASDVLPTHFWWYVGGALVLGIWILPKVFPGAVAMRSVSGMLR